MGCCISCDWKTPGTTCLFSAAITASFPSVFSWRKERWAKSCGGWWAGVEPLAPMSLKQRFKSEKEIPFFELPNHQLEGFRGLHLPITGPKKRLSVAPLESKPFEVPVVVAVATPTLSFLSLRIPIFKSSQQ
uniref:Uncharacterized protein n=1 Tax=Solanum lycopersicum TaxID=4081 RepID=K4CKE2_SOLLC